MREDLVLRPLPAPAAAVRLGRLLRRERDIARLSQQRLADRAGVHQATLARCELGRSAPTLAQIDRVLGVLDLRLRLDVERPPDPRRPWDRETRRLAGMTPDERLEETQLRLADLVSHAQEQRLSPVIDGQVAALLQGVPGVPRWLSVAVTPDQVRAWVTLPYVAGAVGEDLASLYLAKDAAATKILAEGSGLLRSIFGFILVRVVPELPPVVQLRVRSPGDDVEAVDVDVVRLEALPGYLQEPSL